MSILKIEKKSGRFYINKEDVQIAELDFIIDDDVLNAYHTGVRKEYEGQGIASELFDTLVKYSRKNGYKVIPTCPYVLVKFKRRPEEFADIWFKDDYEPTGDSCGIKPKP
jgi:hypothetical protein